jgi:hypothetical protein
MQVFRNDGPLPPNMNIVLRALEPFMLCVRDEDPMAVSVGMLIAFDGPAFAEDPSLQNTVDGLLSSGTCELIRRGEAARN